MNEDAPRACAREARGLLAPVRGKVTRSASARGPAASDPPLPVAPPSPRPLPVTPAPPAPRRLQHRQHRSLAAPPRAGSRLHSRRGDGGSEPASPAGEARAGRWGSVGRRLAFSDLFLVRDDRSSHNFAILLIDFAALYARY